MHLSRTVRGIALALVALLLCSAQSNATRSGEKSGVVPVFPGAEGFGTRTPAGRGGQVLKVTSLGDSGPGSFRSAVTGKGPRIVVFEVGGNIDLKSPVCIREPYLTIAGQTSPSPGIQLRNYGIEIDTHDVLVQHLRVRPNRKGGDGLMVHGNVNAAFNIVIDHCTVNWAGDENLSIWGSRSGYGVHDVTVSNCLIAEGIYGLLIGTDSSKADWLRNISVIDNLFAQNFERDPLITNNCNVLMVNNLAYNAKRQMVQIDGKLGPSDVAFIGNHYLGGPDSSGKPAISLSANHIPGSYYVADCLATGKNVGPLLNAKIRGYLVETPPVFDSTISISKVGAVKENVLGRAGARPAFRDAVEKRLVSEVVNENGTVRSSGNWAEEYARPTQRFFALPENPQGDDDGNGYTNIEEILIKMAAEVEIQRNM